MAKKITAAPKKPRAKKPKKITKIAFVVDRSRSMASIRKPALDAINEQFNTIKANVKKSGETRVWFTQFDHEIECVFADKKAEELESFTLDQYEPRGTTALWDATGRAIAQLEATGVESEDTAFLVIVISDGHENGSREWTSQTLKDKITALEATGKWTITYMLANVDPYAYAAQTGIQLGNMATWQATATGSYASSYAVSSSYANYVSARSVGDTNSLTFYSSTGAPLDTSVPTILTTSTSK